MAKKLQLRRGTTTQHNSFTGAEGEVTVDTTKDSLVVHDGSTQGGHPIAKSSDIPSITGKADLAGANFTGNVLIDNAQELRLGEADGSGTNYTAFKAQAQSGDITLTLPAVAPTANQVLKADGSTPTTLTWATDAATDATKLPLAGGTLSGNVVLNDDVEFQFGAGSGGDLKIYHNGTSHDSFIEERGTGNLKIAASQVQFLNAAKDENVAIFTEDAGSALYYNNSNKLQTSASGVDVTGNIDLTGSVVFEGATADAHETTLAVTDPTADRTITFPDATGTVALGVIGTDIQAHDADTAKLDVDQNWTGAQRGAITALTSAASITIDFGASNNFSLTTGHAAIAFANPSTEVAGQSGSIFITQGATGCTAPTWGNQWFFAGGTAPTLTSGQNAIDRIDYIVQEAGKIHCVASLDLKLTS